MAQLSLTDIDANLRQQFSIPEGTVFHDGLKPPFTLYGLPEGAEAPLCRLPQPVFDQASEMVQVLSRHTAGARIRFATDADEVHFAVTLTDPCLFPHMPLTGSSGLDVYCGQSWCTSVRPVFGSDRAPALQYAGTVKLPGTGLKQVTVYLPLYNGIRSLAVGLAPGARLLPGEGYALGGRPVLFYGSSITQGGCSCRSSTCYTATVTRWLDLDHINLGFSGNALGEEFMARYIASLDLAAFVMDYDHNAPTAEHLEATHEPFFRIIRQAQPQLPILMISKPDFNDDGGISARRRDIVRASYERAVARGDQRVWFLDGETLFDGPDRSLCTVDGCHPNDLGFLRMAQRVEPFLRTMLNMD